MFCPTCLKSITTWCDGAEVVHGHDGVGNVSGVGGGGGIDVDHDNKMRIVSDLKMTARERYDPGSLLLLSYL